MVDVEGPIYTVAYIALILVPEPSHREFVRALEGNRRDWISEILLQACVRVETLRHSDVLAVEFLAGGLHLHANVIDRDSTVQKSLHVDKHVVALDDGIRSPDCV